ncbi:hypothetical protein [Tautonia sociabilis]|uniref:DUF3618 domain-containing protein n=1 Tax=Tautonia sociabilis TaxID=2080755 RepID=A0A432MEI6_9BACT|nr:hypothetical protein [Tautonia sociabilis]RUL83898.1 hypothetical protein TsocGM_21470 [Tautonia sociabilis]
MATTKRPHANQEEIAAIRREMGKIRREIHADVNVAAEHLQATLDWRGYVRGAPWPAVSAAFGVGFLAAWLLVPRHRIKVLERDDFGRVHSEPRYREAVEERAEEKARTKGLFSMALGFLAPIALRAAQNYAIQFIEGRLAESPWAAGGRPEEGSRVQPDQSAPGRPR